MKPVWREFLQGGALLVDKTNRPFSYSAKEIRSNIIFIHFHTQRLLELLSVWCVAERASHI